MSIDRHSRARQIELGQSIAGRRKIYLDARFWIILRDIAIGVKSETAAQTLLEHLRRGVREGRLICPISAGMFLELLKQPLSPNRRIGSARMIDELSLGVAMVPSFTVMATEIHRFLLNAKGDADLHGMQELIWTKVPYVLGDTYPSLPQLPADQELAIQKAFFDHLWAFSLSAMVDTIGDHLPPSDDFVRLSQETNVNNAKYKDELRSCAQTYDTELRGVIEVAGQMAADVIHTLAEKDAGQTLSPSAKQRATTVNVCQNLLYAAFKKPETRSSLRSIHISASLHAGMRWDKSRQFKANDYYDFQHAAAALAYCDAFMTEGPLHHLVTQLGLEEVNGCRVFSDIGAAAEHVRELAVS